MIHKNFSLQSCRSIFICSSTFTYIVEQNIERDSPNHSSRATLRARQPFSCFRSKRRHRVCRRISPNTHTHTARCVSLLLLLLLHYNTCISRCVLCVVSFVYRCAVYYNTLVVKKEGSLIVTRKTMMNLLHTMRNKSVASHGGMTVAINSSDLVQPFGLQCVDASLYLSFIRSNFFFL